MALNLDFLTRIIDVHWSGVSTFVAGDEIGAASYKISDKKWTQISGLPFANPPREFGSVYASAYAMVRSTPVFLIGGFRFHEELFGSWNEGIIMASEDGINFQKVFSFVGIPYEDELVEGPPDPGTDDTHPHHEGQTSRSYIHSIVWDGQRFWAGGYQDSRIIRSPTPFRFTKADVLFISPDGFNWSEVKRTEINYTDEDDEPTLSNRGFIVDYCSTLFTDANGNGVPGGVWGEDKEENIKIGPANPPTVDYTGNDPRRAALVGGFVDTFLMPIGTTSDVRIISDLGVRLADTGVPGVMGVAFANGTWWAVGSSLSGSSDASNGASSSAAFSDDDGRTWRRASLDLSAAATTVCGGKAKSKAA